MCAFTIFNGGGKGIGVKQVGGQVKWSMWLSGAQVLAHLIQVPFDGGIGDGGCLCRDCKDNPAKSGTWPQCRASSRVEKAGLKRAAWAKATRLAVVALPSAVLA